MADRFFCDEPIAWSDEGRASASLHGAEAHHLLHVMRGAVGDRLTLFDGSGYEYAAEIASLSRADVELAVLSREAVDRESPVALTLGVALPKGDRQKVLVEKLTELGVARLAPLMAERSVATPKPSGLEKLRRAVVEASKQCGRNRLMRIDEPTALTDFLRTIEADERAIAHPEGEPLAETAGLGHAGKASAAFAIGPEGGFTDEEVSAAEVAGWRRIGLGPRILRIETAAIALAASRAIDAPGG